MLKPREAMETPPEQFIPASLKCNRTGKDEGQCNFSLERRIETSPNTIAVATDEVED